MGSAPDSRDIRGAPGRAPVARRRARRRHDPAGEAALEGRPGRRSTRSQPGSRTASRSSRRRTARRRRAQCSRGSSAARYRLAWNNSGANLASGVASTLLSAPDADLGLLEVDEFALPEMMRRVRPRVVSLGNLFRDQLDRYGELEHIAERWRAAVAALPPTSTLVVNADDPLVAELADGREQCAPLRRRRSAPRPPGAPARGRLEVLRPLRRALHYAAAYVGHLGDYRCPACGHARPPLDVAARVDRARRRSTRSSFDLVTPAGTARVRLPLPGLYNVYNALAAATTALALDASARRDRGRARHVHSRVRPIRTDRGRRQEDPDAADQEPRRSERGSANARGGRRACRRS